MDRTCVSLIGMPAAGKSTVGVLLAKQLARPFVDTDLLIQTAAGRGLQEIIDSDGLDAFVRLEERFVCDLPLADQVVATGGSVVYSDPAMEHLAAAGTLVYLQISLDALQRRLTDLETRGVVMAAGMSLVELYAERRPRYERWADVTVPCEHLRHQDVVDRIIEAVR